MAHIMDESVLALLDTAGNRIAELETEVDELGKKYADMCSMFVEKKNALDLANITIEQSDREIAALHDRIEDLERLLDEYVELIGVDSDAQD